jgi:two-component system response regulator AtoC
MKEEVMSKRIGRVLVVDDDDAVRTVLGALLRQAGHDVTTAAGGHEALELMGRARFDVCIADVKMPGMDGLELLARLEKGFPATSVVMLSAHATVSIAVEAMRRGACEFLQKPFERDEVLFVVGKALELGTRSHTESPPADQGMVGTSAAMREVHALVGRAARSRATVLVRGESGTGKELVARALHAASSRSAGPFVKVNCGALPDTLLESELFGYERGAFTGATSRKPGRVELAEGGTLFLDEIGDITPAMQVKLLRVLQEREYERLGGKETLKADIRFVAATHRDLESLVESGEFREDLFYRLSVVPVWVPPLRERPEDIGVLARHFCRLAADEAGRDVALDDDAVDLLARQDWPGNVRQLENFVERLVVLSDVERLGAREVLTELSRQASGRSDVALTSGGLFSQRRAAERQAVEHALEQAGNNRTAAARMLGVSRRTLYKKMASLGMS